MTGDAAQTHYNDTEWSTANQQTLTSPSSTPLASDTQQAQKQIAASPIAPQGFSELPYDIVIWDTDSKTNDDIWKSVASSDEQPLLHFFQELSITRIVNPFSTNEKDQLNDYTELWNPNVEPYEAPLALQIENTSEYLSLMQFWDEYGKTALTTLLVLTLLRLLIGPIYEAYKDKKQQKLKRTLKKSAHQHIPANNHTTEFKPLNEAQVLSKQGNLSKASSPHKHSSATATYSKNILKRLRNKHRRRTRTTSTQPLSPHGRAIAAKPKSKMQPQQHKKHHTRRRYRKKTSILKQMLALFSGKHET